MSQSIQRVNAIDYVYIHTTASRTCVVIVFVALIRILIAYSIRAIKSSVSYLSSTRTRRSEEKKILSLYIPTLVGGFLLIFFLLLHFLRPVERRQTHALSVTLSKE